MTKSMSEKSRSFKVISSSFTYTGGRYISGSAMDAAHKAAKELFRKADKDRKSGKKNHVVELQLKEITRTPRVNAKLQVYTYSVTRTLIPEAERKPREFKKPDGSKVIVESQYTYKVTSKQDPDYTGAHVVGGGGGDIFDDMLTPMTHGGSDSEFQVASNYA